MSKWKYPKDAPNLETLLVTVAGPHTEPYVTMGCRIEAFDNKWFQPDTDEYNSDWYLLAEEWEEEVIGWQYPPKPCNYPRTNN